MKHKKIIRMNKKYKNRNIIKNKGKVRIREKEEKEGGKKVDHHLFPTVCTYWYLDGFIKLYFSVRMGRGVSLII